jgi:hypothetical protein
VGVIRIINDQGSTQAITILGLEMAVIPICPLNTSDLIFDIFGSIKVRYRLLRWVELVEEALKRYNGTLSDEGRTVRVIGCLL